MIDSALFLSVLICIVEIVLGVLTIIGGKIKLVSYLMLLMMFFFNFLTWHTANCDASKKYVDRDTYAINEQLAQIKLEEAKTNKSWEVGFGFSVKEETSRGDKLPFKKIECIGENIEIISQDKGIRLRVTNSKQFSFNGELDLKDFLLGQNPKFCAINFYTG
jgi:hypothetical protein